jgi:phosphate:Na+ symporter
MNYTFVNFLALLGAISLFIYGMRAMSDGLQKLVGKKIRNILNTITANRFISLATGIVTTLVVQLSSATVVMTISFVNAGILNVRQAIAVIMGANIGTTLKVWIFALIGLSKFNLSEYILPLLGLSFPLLFAKRKNVKSWGEFITGFCILFLALGYVVETAPEFGAEFIGSFEHLINNGIWSILLFVLIGTIITMLVQSSSVAFALTLVMCQKGFPFELGAALVLGENIGTTIAPNLAAIVANSKAKRAAIAHTIFNVTGATIAIIFFNWYIVGIDYVMSATKLGSPLLNENLNSVYTSLALFHTSFNVITTIILIGFIEKIEILTTKIFPSNELDENHNLRYINSGVLNTPELSILEAFKEIERFVNLTTKMNEMILDLLIEKNQNAKEELLKKLNKYEQIADKLKLDISIYLTQLNADEAGEEVSESTRQLLAISSELESICDLYFSISKLLEKKDEDHIYFMPDQRENLKNLLILLEDASYKMSKNLTLNKVDVSISQIKHEEIVVFKNKLSEEYLKKIESGTYGIKGGSIYNQMLGLLERVGEHIFNIVKVTSKQQKN